MLYNICTGIYKFGNNTHPQRIRRRSKRSHFSGEKKVRLMGQEIRYIACTVCSDVNVSVSACVEIKGDYIEK